MTLTTYDVGGHPMMCETCWCIMVFPAGRTKPSAEGSAASADYADSLYDEDQATKQDLDEEHTADGKTAVPGHIGMIEPIPADPTSKDEMHYAILTRIFDARKGQALSLIHI